MRNFAGKLPLQDFYIPKNIPGRQIVMQDWCRRQAPYRVIVVSGRTHQGHLSDLVNSCLIRSTSRRGCSIRSSSVSCCTVGGDTSHTAGSSSSTWTTRKYPTSSTTRSTPAKYLRPNYGSGLVDQYPNRILCISSHPCVIISHVSHVSLISNVSNAHSDQCIHATLS